MGPFSMGVIHIEGFHGNYDPKRSYLHICSAAPETSSPNRTVRHEPNSGY